MRLRDTPTRPVVTAQDLRDHLRHVLQIVATFGIIILSCVAVSIGFDVHAMRVDEIQSAAEMRAGVSSRVDALLWKTDTFLTMISALNKSLAAGLTQVRVQVKESSEDQTKSIKATSNAATAAVKQSTELASQVLEKVSEAPKPVVNVELPKSPAPAVVVNSPAAPVTVHAAPPHPADLIPKRRTHWHWLRKLWPFGASHDGRRPK